MVSNVESIQTGTMSSSQCVSSEGYRSTVLEIKQKVVDCPVDHDYMRHGPCDVRFLMSIKNDIAHINHIYNCTTMPNILHYPVQTASSVVELHGKSSLIYRRSQNIEHTPDPLRRFSNDNFVIPDAF